MRDLLSILLSVFIAELGDKTQIATMLFATNSRIGKGGVFLGPPARWLYQVRSRLQPAKL